MTKSKMFYGWWIVVLVFVAYAFGGATIWYGFTAFFDPLVEEFAWSYTAISVAASIRGAEFGLMDTVTGFLVDRFSIRKIIFAGSAVMGIGWLILSQVNSLGVFYASFMIVCIGASGISGVVLFTLVTRWFHKRLGLVIGITASGVCVGGFAVPAIVSLLDVISFRSVFFIFGVTAIIIGAITAYFVRDWPKDVGSVPDGIIPPAGKSMAEKGKEAAPEEASPKGALRFREAISKPAFWIITYVYVAALFSWVTVVTHILRRP